MGLVLLQTLDRGLSVSSGWVLLCHNVWSPQTPALGVVPGQLPGPLSILKLGHVHSPLLDEGFPKETSLFVNGTGRAASRGSFWWETLSRGHCWSCKLSWGEKRVQKYLLVQSGQDLFSARVQLHDGCVTFSKSSEVLEPQCYHL